MLKPILLISSLLLTANSASAEQWLQCGKMLDSKAGKVVGERWIQVEGERIGRILKSAPKKTDNLINLSEMTCLPGLIDMHVHLDQEMHPKRYIERFTQNPADLAFLAQSYAKKTLLAGFTTVRNPGDSYNVTIALRNAINKGLVNGPRIFTAGKALATTGGHADPTNGFRKDLMGNPDASDGVVNGVASARQAVRQRYKDGADFIKITATGGVLSLAKSGQNPQFTQDELEALIDTADDYGMHVAAHAHGTEGMLRAVEAGITTIEHGTYMDKAVMKAMKMHGTYYVPTIIAGKYVAEKSEIDGFFPEVVRPKAAAVGPQIQKTFAKAYKAGVKIAFGTDSGVSAHGDNAKEFEYMVEVGMPAMAAIQSATINNAQVLDDEANIGSIETGKYADIIAVKGDPTKDVRLLQRLNFVMKAGVIYK